MLTAYSWPIACSVQHINKIKIQLWQSTVYKDKWHSFHEKTNRNDWHNTARQNSSDACNTTLTLAFNRTVPCQTFRDMPCCHRIFFGRRNGTKFNGSNFISADAVSSMTSDDQCLDSGSKMSHSLAWWVVNVVKDALSAVQQYYRIRNNYTDDIVKYWSDQSSSRFSAS